MKSTALLLNLYECIYGFAVAIVLVASGLAAASGLSLPGVWFLAPLALAPLGLLALGVARRLREFRRYAHIAGPKPSFFLRSLRSLLLHEHGARDRALVELHQAYGPVVKVHMAASRSSRSRSHRRSSDRAIWTRTASPTGPCCPEA